MNWLTDVEYLSNQLDVEGFVMDSLGNRTGNQTLSDETVNFTVQSSTNRYTSIGGNSITHDDAGNVTVDKDGYQHTYDYENRVVKVEDVNDVAVATFAYDALGRRIRNVDSVAEETLLFYYNPDWQCLAEYNGADTLQRYFIYGNYIDEPLVINDGTDDFYYVQDHLYSTVALIGYVDSAWTVAERYEYDAYGTTHIMDASYNSRSVSSYGNPYSFTGRRLDMLDDGNLLRMHYRHRDYDTYAGRFLQHDPLGLEPMSVANVLAPNEQYHDGLNLYQMDGSSPVMYVDAHGLRRYEIACSPIQEGEEWWREWLRQLGIRHCELHERGLAAPGDDVYPVWRRVFSGKLKRGPGNKKPCKCATLDEIAACVDIVEDEYPWGSMYPNCHTQTKAILKFCCLKSTWDPPWVAGPVF